jgi:hypothetical protein
LFNLTNLTNLTKIPSLHYFSAPLSGGVLSGIAFGRPSKPHSISHEDAMEMALEQEEQRRAVDFVPTKDLFALELENAMPKSMRIRGKMAIEDQIIKAEAQKERLLREKEERERYESQIRSEQQNNSQHFQNNAQNSQNAISSSSRPFFFTSNSTYTTHSSSNRLSSSPPSTPTSTTPNTNTNTNANNTDQTTSQSQKTLKSTASQSDIEPPPTNRLDSMIADWKARQQEQHDYERDLIYRGEMLNIHPDDPLFDELHDRSALLRAQYDEDYKTYLKLSEEDDDDGGSGFVVPDLLELLTENAKNDKNDEKNEKNENSGAIHFGDLLASMNPKDNIDDDMYYPYEDIEIDQNEFESDLIDRVRLVRIVERAEKEQKMIQDAEISAKIRNDPAFIALQQDPYFGRLRVTERDLETVKRLYNEYIIEGKLKPGESLLGWNPELEEEYNKKNRIDKRIDDGFEALGFDFDNDAIHLPVDAIAGLSNDEFEEFLFGSGGSNGDDDNSTERKVLSRLYGDKIDALLRQGGFGVVLDKDNGNNNGSGDGRDGGVDLELSGDYLLRSFEKKNNDNNNENNNEDNNNNNNNDLRNNNQIQTITQAHPFRQRDYARRREIQEKELQKQRQRRLGLAKKEFTKLEQKYGKVGPKPDKYLDKEGYKEWLEKATFLKKKLQKRVEKIERYHERGLKMALNKLDTHVLTMLDLERELLTEEISDYTLMEMYNLMLERSPEEIEEMLNVIEENVKIEEEELEEAMNKMKQSNKRFKSVL